MMDDDKTSVIPTIRVIAPATLPEGYSFDVMVDGGLFTVHIPAGGVKEGQEFEVLYDRTEHHSQYSGKHQHDDDPSKARYEQEEDEEIATLPAQTMSEEQAEDQQQLQEEEVEEEDVIWYDETTGAPIGRWRIRLCSCCEVLTQSTFWMGFCCTPILIAQLITRLGLTWNGRAASTKEEQSLSYNRIILSMILTMSIGKIPFLGGLVVFIFYAVIVFYVGSHVRAHVRQKYKIPPTLSTKNCNLGQRLDDCCCMVFCGCCSAIQMARHTHDDRDYPGHGCTTTGLGMDAPNII